MAKPAPRSRSDAARDEPGPQQLARARDQQGRTRSPPSSPEKRSGNGTRPSGGEQVPPPPGASGVDAERHHHQAQRAGASRASAEGRRRGARQSTPRKKKARSATRDGPLRRASRRADGRSPACLVRSQSLLAQRLDSRRRLYYNAPPSVKPAAPPRLFRTRPSVNSAGPERVPGWQGTEPCPRVPLNTTDARPPAALPERRRGRVADARRALHAQGLRPRLPVHGPGGRGRGPDAGGLRQGVPDARPLPGDGRAVRRLADGGRPQPRHRPLPARAPGAHAADRGPAGARDGALGRRAPDRRARARRSARRSCTRGLRALPPDLREPLVLCDLQGLPVRRDRRRRCGSRSARVKSRINRARLELAKRLLRRRAELVGERVVRG